MAVILTPDKWRRQPSGAVDIGWGKPLTSGLQFATCGFSPLISRNSRNLAEQYRYNVVRSDSPIGHGYYASGAPAGICWNTGYSASGTDAFTLECYLIASAAANLSCPVALCPSGLDAVNGYVTETGTNGDLRGLMAFQGSSPYNAYFWGSNRDLDSQTLLTLNVPQHIVVTGYGGNQIAIYINGKLAKSGTTGGGSLAASGPYFAVHTRHVSGSNFTGVISKAAFYSRALSGAEVAELSANPWQIFRKAGRIYFFPSAAGGAYTLTAGSGSFSLTGTAATLKVGRVLSCGSGSFALSGTAATLKAGRLLSAASGTYAVSGTAADLRKSSILAATSGSFALTGTAATLTYTPAGSYSLSADSGSYTLNGTTVALRVGRILPAASGSYAFTGTNVTLSRGRTMAAASGSFALTGTNISFARSYVLTASSGSFALSGSDVSLTYSGAPVVVPPTTGGGGGPMIIKERGLRDELARIRKEREEAALRRQIQREDEEIVLIMAALAA